MKDERIASLLIKHIEEELTEAERRELSEWMEASDSNRFIAEEFLDEERLKAGVQDMLSKEVVWMKIGEGIRNKELGEFGNSTIRQFDNGSLSTGGVGISNKEQGILNDEVDGTLSTEGNEVSKNEEEENIEQGTRNDEFRRKGKVKRMQILKWVAAASILGFVIWSLLFVINRDKGSDLPMANSPKVEDVKAPEINRAMITLADGRRVYLDSVGNGSLANMSGVEVVKLEDGKIVYRRESSIVNREMVYNTLTNPRGSKVIDITLSDGSRVWLNAGSSLRYPVVFGNDNREVEMSGEGYFEVNSVNRESSIVKGRSPGSSGLKGAKIPFFVKSGEVVTEVVGTHFNVNAYEDEGEIRVTLLEGAVNVKRESSTVKGEGVKLVPGQSAVAKSMGNELSVMSGVDTEEVMAWKNGRFIYSGVDIGTIMRQVSRWYDVEVVFEENINEKFYAEVPRNTNVSTLLKMLETTKAVRFEIEGKKVKVRR